MRTRAQLLFLTKSNGGPIVSISSVVVIDVAVVVIPITEIARVVNVRLIQ